MDKPTFELINFQRQKVGQINGNFKNVFKAKLLTQPQINAQMARIKNHVAPELENKIRKKRKEFQKTGSQKVKVELERDERQLLEYQQRLANPKRAQTRSELVHGVMQEVVLPGSMDFAYRQANYHRRWFENIHRFQNKTFSTSCTRENFNQERAQILADLDRLDIIDKQ